MNSGKYTNIHYDNNNSASPHSGINSSFHVCVDERTAICDHSHRNIEYDLRTSNTNTMSPLKSKSWTYFKKVDQFLAKCKICSQEIKYCGNTSNVNKHLKKHKNILAETTTSEISSINMTSGSTAKQLTSAKVSVPTVPHR